MAESFFRIHKGITVSNTSASANLDPISLVLSSLVANNTGVYAGIMNASSFNVGTVFTANSVLANAAAINIRGQTNTVTLLATTSANVGANVQLTTSGFLVGDATVNVVGNSSMLVVKNATNQTNVAAGSVECGISKINSTMIVVGPNMVLNSSMLAISGSTVALLGTEDQVVAGGARVTVKDLGTITTGTVTPDPGDRPIQKYTNNGSHTLAPGSNVGAYLLTIVNGASAGAITTSGWTKVAGDAFTTTNAQKFRCHCSVDGDGSLLMVQALQ